jgi:tol-pal system protein YbgF
LNRRLLQFAFVTAATAALSGCYGAKIFKGPIHTEHTAFAADTILAEQRRIMQRLDALEARVDAQTAGNARLSASLGELEDAVRALVAQMEESRQINPGGRGSNSGSRSAPPAAMDGAEEAYRAAYGDVTSGNYELAAQGFQDFLARYPDSPRVAEAHFYLGECQYAEERYLEAAGEYQKVVRDFSASRLAPAAYLKMGRAYVQLEERSLAEKAFRTLIEKHPTSEEAKQAESALKQLGG